MKCQTFAIFGKERQRGVLQDVPADLMQAHQMFHANCGPASFAALVGALITDIIRFFPHFPQSPHTTIPHMQKALRDCAIEYRTGESWPTIGLSLIQFIGDWTERNSFHESAKNRHWIAVKRGAVYDVNAHAWLPLERWKSEIMLPLVEARLGATGWRLERSYEVLPVTRHLPEFPMSVKDVVLREPRAA